MKLLTALESGMPDGNLEDHRPLLLRIVDTGLRAEMRTGHLRCLETHDAKVFAHAGMKWGLASPVWNGNNAKRRTSCALWSNNHSKDEGGWCILELDIGLTCCQRHGAGLMKESDQL